MQGNRSALPAALARWAPLVLWLALIFLLSNQPKAAIPSYGVWDLLVKKGAHFVAYGVLALLARRAGFTPAAALALTLAYAVSDELHQLQIAGRHGQPADVLIDGAGAATMLLVLPWLQARAPRLGRVLGLPAQSGQRDGAGERLSRGA